MKNQVNGLSCRRKDPCSWRHHKYQAWKIKDKEGIKIEGKKKAECQWAMEVSSMLTYI